jgi:hypothetical protein
LQQRPSAKDISYKCGIPEREGSILLLELIANARSWGFFVAGKYICKRTACA